MLRQWFDPDDTFNELGGSFFRTGRRGPTVCGRVGADHLFAVRAARRLDRRRRWVLIGLRMFIVAVTWVLLLQPGVRLEHVSRVRNHIPVMVDTSRSKGLTSDDPSKNRPMLQRRCSPLKPLC